MAIAYLDTCIVIDLIEPAGNGLPAVMPFSSARRNCAQRLVFERPMRCIWRALCITAAMPSGRTIID